MEHPLPITIRTDEGNVYRIRPPMNKINEDESFWGMLAGMVAEVKEAVGTELYRTLGDSLQENLHLDLAAHLYPQLLTLTRQLRYTKANPSESIIARKNYKEFLTAF